MEVMIETRGNCTSGRKGVQEIFLHTTRHFARGAMSLPRRQRSDAPRPSLAGISGSLTRGFPPCTTPTLLATPPPAPSLPWLISRDEEHNNKTRPRSPFFVGSRRFSLSFLVE
ncbi:unnamed protein product [Ectocarpus sp. 13 AM-2016]